VAFFLSGALVGRAIGSEAGAWIGERIGVKGKFEKHRKFFYFVGPQDPKIRDGHPDFGAYAIGSGRRTGLDEIANLIRGGWWRHCPQCIKAGGAKEPTFHVEEQSRGPRADVVLLDGVSYDKRYSIPRPGVLPPGIPTTTVEKAKLFHPASLIGPPAQIITPSEIETEEVPVVGKPILAGMDDTTIIVILVGGAILYLLSKGGK